MVASPCEAIARTRLFRFLHASAQGPGNYPKGFQMSGARRLASPWWMALTALLGLFQAETATAEASVWKDPACSSVAPSKACCKTRATANCCCKAVPIAAQRSRTDALARRFDEPSRAVSPAIDHESHGSACKCNSDWSDLPDSTRRRRADDPRPALQQARYADPWVRMALRVPGSPAQGESVQSTRWPLYLRISHLMI
jgi:hypothetical protein